MSLSHWDWRVSGCCLEGQESRNCLAGLRGVCVCAPMGVSAWLLEEVSHETLVLQTLTCEFLRKSRTKRSFWRLAAQPSAEIVRVECANAGESVICPMRAQPSAEIARVERAKCRRECNLSGARATLCGDRACRAREMQASTGDFVVQL